jgi:two-component system response regulator YesN
MNVLIADDEKISREGLRDVVDWKRLGLRVVFCAANGREALDYIDKNPVDILITDIRMPKMDGLALLQCLSERAAPPAAIILSGFGDFGYAQSAIKYGVLNYLLKPIRPRELHAALEQAVEKRKAQDSSAPSSEEYAQYQATTRLAAHELCDKLGQAVSLADEKTAIALCGELRDLFLSGGYSSSLYKKYAFRAVYQCVHFGENYLGQDIPYFNDMEPLEKIASAQGYKEIALQLERCLKDLCGYIGEAQRSQKKRLAGEVVTILQHRYGDPALSVAQLAGELGVTPNYLSALFKRQMGQTFSEYLEDLRMEKAKLLLGDVRYKIYEVAARVGYNDSKHFSKVFKAKFGQAPAGFRS